MWSLIGNQMFVRPVPHVGTALLVTYYRSASLLFEDNDSPDLPSNAYPAIVAKAAQLC